MALSTLSFAQMQKEDVEYELLRFNKNNCYRFSISDVGSTKEADFMVEANFELKFGERVLSIKCGEHDLAIPYNSISYIKSSDKTGSREGKFVIYIH